MKLFACLAIALWATSTTMGWAAPSAEIQHPAVVRVIAPERDGTSYGSGSLVAVDGPHGLIITNWHVVRDATGQIVVVFPDGFRSGATVLRTDSDWDLAALAIWRPGVEPIPLATDTPRPGEPLTIAGYGSGRYRAITGRCTQYVAPGANHPFEMVELSAGARDGDSGGPIFNSRGELAGVLFGAARGHTTGSYCGRVRWFLASIDDDFQRLPPGSTRIARQPQPSPTTTARPLQPSPTATARRSEPRPAIDEMASNPLPVAVIPAGASAFAESAASQPPAVLPDTGWTTSPPQLHGDNQVAQPESTEQLDWDDVAGTTLAEQIKTILAAIGLLAIFLGGLRLLSKE